MAAVSAASCYSPLDPTLRTIRLLLLSPKLNANDGRIQCSLVETPLDGARPYEALSYTWGIPDDLDLKIYLDSTLVTVRRNLWVALHYLQRDISRDRVLWIDALCIHQGNTKERNHQVGFMGEIYKQAEVVLAWLGEPSDAALHDEILSHCELDEPRIGHIRTTSEFEVDTTCSSKLAFDVLRAAAAGADVLNIDAKMMVPIDRLDRWFMEFVQSPKFGAQWKSILEICNAEYWNRLWVIQEIGLAKRVKVLYGNAYCDWDDFSIPISILGHWRDTFNQRFSDTTGSFLSLQIGPVAKFVEREFRQPRGMMRSRSLTNLLSISEKAHCQERGDRIYGLLGFLDENERAQIPVDYSKSLYQIFNDVIKSRIQQQSSDLSLLVHFSEVLQRALLGPLGNESGPCQMFGDGMASTLWGNGRQANHSDKKCDTFQFEKFAGIKSTFSSLLSTNEEFELHAMVLGRIRVVEVPAGNLVFNRVDFSVEFSLEGQGQPPQKRTPFGGRQDANGPSSEDHDIQRILRYNASKLRDLWRADHQILIESELAQPTSKTLSMPQKELNNHVALFEVNEPKWLLKGDGYIGVANSNIQNGDLLCIFPPSEVTAVIRSWNFDGKRKDGGYVKCSFIGRAIVSSGRVRRGNESVYSHSYRNWPPPDFYLEPTILNHTDKSGIMAPRRRLSHKHEKDGGPPTLPKSARISITIKELQALTCPLKRRHYEENDFFQL